MPLIQWDSRYSLQLEGIDEDHREMINAFNSVWVVASQGLGAEQIHLALENAFSIMQRHFRSEEALLELWAYPRLRYHKREHQKLTSRLESIINDVHHSDVSAINAQTFHFVGDWLCGHILKTDRHYDQYIAKLRMQGGAAASLGNDWGMDGARLARLQIFPQLGFGLIVTIFLFWISLVSEQNSEKARFQELATQRLYSVQANVTLAQDTITNLTHLLALHRGLSDTEFAAFGAQVSGPSKVIQTLEWRHQLDVAPDLAGRLRQGQIVCSGRIELEAGADRQYGVRVLAPVTVADQAEPVGYVDGVMRVGALFNLAMGGDGSNEALRLYVFDLSAPDATRQLYPKYPAINLDELTAAPHAVSTVQVGGREWRVVVVPIRKLAWLVPLNAVLVLAGGLIATFFMVYHQKSTQEQMESTAQFANEIARTKRRLGEAHRIARLGYVELDHVSGIWILGEGTQAMLGLDASLTAGSSKEVFAHVAGADRGPLDEFLRSYGRCGLDVELHVGDRVLLAVGENLGRNGLVITFQDITLRHEAEQERTAMIQRMSEASRLESLGTLAGGVAHEINTPAQYIGDNLQFIKGWLPRLLDLAKEARAASVSNDWEPVREKAMALKFDFAARELPAATDQALDGIGRITSIVQAIKEFSFPSAKTSQLFDFNRIVSNACTVTRNQWKYVAEVKLDLDPHLPQINAIEGEINQILVNLIVNAADAIAELGQVTLGRIDVRTRRDGDFVELVVADTGTGISEENQGRLFELFFTTKAPGKGTGQGLAITKSIVLRHGGTITVDSVPGQGTSFHVRLPIAAAQMDGAST